MPKTRWALWTVLLALTVAVFAVVSVNNRLTRQREYFQAKMDAEAAQKAAEAEAKARAEAERLAREASQVSLRSFTEAPQAQVDEYNADKPKSVIQLQQFRTTASAEVKDEKDRPGTATLINLNPAVNAWFLLGIEWDDGRKDGIYHIENQKPESRKIALDPAYPLGLVISENGNSYQCDLWSGSSKADLLAARALGKPFVPLCEDRIYLRNPTKGSKTSKEWVAEFLREYVWEGEQIVSLVKEKYYQDAFLLSSDVLDADKEAANEKPAAEDAPAPPLLAGGFEKKHLIPSRLGIDLIDQPDGKVRVGQWYAVKALPGVFVSAIKPGLVSQDIVKAQKSFVNPLDSVESIALVYLVAFDLDRFDVGFTIGTENPGVGWSDRVPWKVRDEKLPGPDGIGTVSPIVPTGLLEPDKATRAAATFIGGFKRHHGGFRYTDFATKNHGSHYGFIEEGAVLSKLVPGLATFVAHNDGAVTLKTWTEKDNADLAKIRYARQNGLPIIDYDERTKTSKPGALVPYARIGNWSGSQDKSYRTLRAGLALQEKDGRRFLIYGYFTAATPSPMARVFAAYQCKYAMLLDMNALEHTYLALYLRKNGQVAVQHLIKGMDELDKSDGKRVLPRFLGFPDNRDFFYLLEKKKT